MNRRTFLCGLTLGAVAASLAAEGQQARKVRIGWLSTGPHPFIEAFRQGLRDLGYVEGQTFVIEERYAEGRPERLTDLAVELVALPVDVIVTSGTRAGRAAKEATTSVPIVLVTSDLVRTGLVKSLAHPGGNVTGLAIKAGEHSPKWLELLKQALPKLSRVGVLVDPSAIDSTQLHQLGGDFHQLQAVARSLAVRLIPFEAHDGDGIDQAFARAAKERVGAIIPESSPVFAAEKRRIVDLAARHHMPAMYEHRDFVEAGGLVSYGPDLRQVFSRAAAYVDRLVKGTKPADLPVEQPTKFELVVNLKTAKALGLTIPPSLLLRADQVIE